MLSDFKGLKYLLNYIKDYGAKRLLYISSSEVCGPKSDGNLFKEDDYGYIDLLNPHNSYSVCKRAVETLWASYYAEYCVESLIVGLRHIYGSIASPYDDRISSAFAYAAYAVKSL